MISAILGENESLLGGGAKISVRMNVVPTILLFLRSVVWSGFGAPNAADWNNGNRMPNVTWKLRVMTQKELEKLSEKDMDLSPSAVEDTFQVECAGFRLHSAGHPRGKAFKGAKRFHCIQALDATIQIHS